jgi:4,5-dihydroxyphthalate decarboxylase
MVTALRVSLGVCRGPVTDELAQRRIGIQGVEADISCLPPAELFWRQLRSADFDISELSLASLMISVSLGNTTWVALPIFTERHFFHTDTIVRPGAGISSPKDLEGRRIGVPEYQQTASLWTRGIFRDEFGVDTQAVHWCMEHSAELSHAAAVGVRTPPGTPLEYIPMSESIGSLLRKGDLDGTIRYGGKRNLLDRSQGDVVREGVAVPLFKDPKAEARRYFAKSGLRPMNHCIVIRRQLAEAHPWLVQNVYDAFAEAKSAVLDRAVSLLESMYGEIPSPLKDGVDARSMDPLPFGLKSQTADVETVARYLLEEGLTERRVALDEVFAELSFVL